jgi:hypothetical protein
MPIWLTVSKSIFKCQNRRSRSTLRSFIFPYISRKMIYNRQITMGRTSINQIFDNTAMPRSRPEYQSNRSTHSNCEASCIHVGHWRILMCHGRSFPGLRSPYPTPRLRLQYPVSPGSDRRAPTFVCSDSAPSVVLLAPQTLCRDRVCWCQC